MSETTPNANNSPDISTLLSSLLSNPETLSKINGILSKYTSSENRDNSPLTPQNNKSSEEIIATIGNNNINSSNEPPTEQVLKSNEIPFDFTKIASLFGEGIDPQKYQNKEQIALLLAIRPYLSPRRRELIDAFIKFNRIGIFLNKFNQNGGQNVLQ